MPLVVIAGAGISVPSGLPTFLELRDGLLKAIFPSHIGDIDASNLDDAPESVFYTAARRPGARDGVVAYVVNSLSGAQPDWNHEVLANIVMSGGTVWTPNFDTLIEQAASRPLLRISLGDRVPQDVKGHLLKPHGTIYPHCPPSEQRLIFTSDAIVQPPGRDWQAALVSSFENADVLIWGYRGADVDLMPLIVRASDYARSVTWCSAVPAERDSVRKRLPRALVPNFDGPEPYEAIKAHIVDRFLRPYNVPVPVPARVNRLGVSRARVEPQLAVQAPERANLAASIFGDAVARDFLLLGLLTESNRAEIAARLVRSLYFDQPSWRPFLRKQIRRARHIPVLRNAPLISMLWLIGLDVDGARQRDVRALKRVLRRTKLATSTPDATARAWILYNRVRASSLLRSIGHLRDLEDVDEDVETGLYAVLVRDNAPMAVNHLFNLAETARLMGDLRRSEAVVSYFYATWNDFAPPRWRLLMATSRAYAQLLAGDVSGAESTVELAQKRTAQSRQSSSDADLRICGAMLTLVRQFLGTQPPTATMHVDLDVSVATATRSARLMLVQAEHARSLGESEAARMLFERVLQTPSLYSRALAHAGLALCGGGSSRRARTAAKASLRASGGTLWWMEPTGVIRSSTTVMELLSAAETGPVLTLAVA